MTKKKDYLNILIAGLIILICITGFLFYKTKSDKVEDVRIYTNDKVTESSGELVDGFPNIPIYEGIKLDKSYRREQNEKIDYSAFWYHDIPLEEITVVYKWYVDEFKKAGYEIAGPFTDDKENELHLVAENDKYKIQLYNSRRQTGDEAGPPGELIGIQINEK